ncbi:hypothetical protein ACFYUD_34060 [Nocardia tengchongensis]|uniref:hypothetical protein n=1 Tax=Nocardia tengchongensis TaxID=2055889 RepID=UPI00367FF55B
MTLIDLPAGRTLPEPFEGTALDPIIGFSGCYDGLLWWAEYQWPEFEFDDWFYAREQHQWWQERFAAVESGTEEPPIDVTTCPPDGYGVGDTVEQILKHRALAWVFTDPRDLIVVFTEVRRGDQPLRGGWRFHKHGTYIGAHDVEWEYLAEQDGIRGERIDSVVMYHVVQVVAHPKHARG